MEVLSIISLASGFASIILGVYAICFSKKESKKSDENYKNAQDVLDLIQHKTELIDRSVQLQQTQLVEIINKALDRIGQPPLDIQPLSLEEIEEILKNI